MRFTGLVLASLILGCNGFLLQPGTTAVRGSTRCDRKNIQPLVLCNAAPRRSGFEGNQRAPTEQELKVMDEMIMKLANAKPYDLPNAVRRAFRVVSSPQFFLRIASLTDEAKDGIEKEKLTALATNLVSTIDAVVSTMEDKMDEQAEQVERVIKAAAEPDSGEFLVPLTPERIDAMRNALESLDPLCLDESFLNTIDAWMNKSHEDGMDGMVGILQKSLQMYAGLQVLRARDIKNLSTDKPPSKLFDSLLQTDTEKWDAEIKAALQDDDTDVSSSALISEVQKTMEGVILGLENGSMAQRVQAEYLRELVTRIEALQ